MRCKGRRPSTPSAEHAIGDKAQPKNAITQARRDQNRRAQRAFRERRRAKKRYPLSATPRLLAPHPPEGLDVTVRPANSDIHDGPAPSSSDQVTVDGPQDHQDPSSANTKEEGVVFTFSSPQTLFPTQKSLVPRRRTPYSDLLNLMRDSPRRALLPHGVTATLAACLFNSRALGIDIDRVLDPHYMSPFYQPSFSLMHPPASTDQTPPTFDFASDQTLTILGPLRPCFAQMIFPHHACIDLLPLPGLRETAVMLNAGASHSEEASGSMTFGFDCVQELKKDVYVRQGVRFRGAGEVSGEEYVMYDEGGRGRHCGHPWESGSWAVTLWFARKWRHVVEI